MSMHRRAALLSLAAVLVPLRSSKAAERPPVTVHKDPNCGCCAGWVDHLEAHGFKVKTIETVQLNPLKAQLGIPVELRACHTAQLGGYVIEGHVPARAIEKLLAERPKASGLAVPGMPQGSPGMTGDLEEYEVILFSPNEQRVFGRFKGEHEV